MTLKQPSQSCFRIDVSRSSEDAQPCSCLYEAVRGQRWWVRRAKTSVKKGSQGGRGDVPAYLAYSGERVWKRILTRSRGATEVFATQPGNTSCARRRDR